ncbi:MAG: TonB family protein [Pyrinomonadaceae bacterium]
MLTLYGLRLLVALLTFAVGVSAAWLLDFKPARACAGRDVTTVTAIEVPDLSMEAPPSSHSCSLKSPGHVVQGGTLDFKATSKPAPLYPPAAKAAGIMGTVVVRVLVDESGDVLTAEATSGHALLREAAEAAAREARFTPTRLSGQPIMVAGVITYNFVLK